MSVKIKDNPLVSIIVRTKNEEKWISSCLESICRQDYPNFEVILVDNCSTDKTLEKAKQFDITLVNIDEFLPGKAINDGIRVSKGELICIISGHCIPVNDQWLSNLVRNFEDEIVAGVYGRQEPMSFTSDLDKRDLINTFGLDRRVQIKDSFFHNANSMIRRDVWNNIPFDEEVTNIEDRVWAKAVLKQKYVLIYEPESSVYHYHGIHHGRNVQRAKNIVRIMESLEEPQQKTPKLSGLNVVAMIPATGPVKYLQGDPLIKYTIDAALDSKYVNDVYVTTDSEDYQNLAQECGAKAPFLRPTALSYNYVELVKIYRFTLEKLAEQGVHPDLLVLLEQEYPFRTYNLIDELTELLFCGGYDTVLPVKPEYKLCWGKKNDQYMRLDKGLMPTAFKDPIYLGLLGLGCVTHPQLIHAEERLGNKVGILEVHNSYSSIEVKCEETQYFAEKVLEGWKQSQGQQLNKVM